MVGIGWGRVLRAAGIAVLLVLSSLVIGIVTVGDKARIVTNVGLAAVLMYRERPMAAVVELELALERAADPAIIADVIAARPNFAELHEMWFWTRLEAIQQGRLPGTSP